MYHIVALSGGKDSTALALRLQEVEPRKYNYVCTPTGDEPEEFFAHMRYLQKQLGQKIHPLMHPLGLNGLIEKNQALPNFRMRWCTLELKIKPYQTFLRQYSPAISYVGLRADEDGRVGGVYNDLPNVTMRFPLREWGWTEEDVLTYLEEQGVSIPFRLDCQRCFFQTLYEWWRLWRDALDVYTDAENQEAMTGHTFRSPQRDSQPASLKELREKFEAGYEPQPRGSALKRLQCRVCTL